MCVLEESILAIKKSDLFKDFSEKEIELLLTNNASIIKSFSPGMRIISEEDIPNKIMILISGKVIIAKDTDDYLEHTLGELLPLAFTGKNLDK